MKRNVISDRAPARKRAGLLGRSLLRLGALACVMAGLTALGEIAPRLRAPGEAPLRTGIVLHAAPLAPPPLALLDPGEPLMPAPLNLAPATPAPRPAARLVRLHPAQNHSPLDTLDVLSGPELSVISQSRD